MERRNLPGNDCSHEDGLKARAIPGRALWNPRLPEPFFKKISITFAPSPPDPYGNDQTGRSRERYIFFLGRRGPPSCASPRSCIFRLQPDNLQPDLPGKARDLLQPRLHDAVSVRHSFLRISPSISHGLSLAPDFLPNILSKIPITLSGFHSSLKSY